jgi:transposase
MPGEAKPARWVQGHALPRGPGGARVAPWERSADRPGDQIKRPATDQRIGCKMLSAITDLSHRSFQVFEGSFNVKVFLGSLTHLLKQAHRKVLLIVDGHPVHRAKLVQVWQEEHKDEIEIIYLPGYSPELNPNEMLNQDVKASALLQRCPKNVRQLKADVRSYLFSTQKRPDVVRKYFEEQHVQYARAEAA